jgi:hypothetical protein
MLMQDRLCLAVADWLLAWIDRQVERPAPAAARTQ